MRARQSSIWNSQECCLLLCARQNQTCTNSHSCCSRTRYEIGLSYWFIALSVYTYVTVTLWATFCLPFYDSAGTCGRRIKTQNSIKMHIAAMRGIFPYFLHFFLLNCAPSWNMLAMPLGSCRVTHTSQRGPWINKNFVCVDDTHTQRHSLPFFSPYFQHKNNIKSGWDFAIFLPFFFHASPANWCSKCSLLGRWH